MLKLNKKHIIWFAVILVLAAVISSVVTLQCAKPKHQSIIVLRDSLKSAIADSLTQAQAIHISQANTSHEVYVKESEKRKFKKSLLIAKYENIKKSNVDSTFNDVLQYINNWKPEN